MTDPLRAALEAASWNEPAHGEVVLLSEALDALAWCERFAADTARPRLDVEALAEAMWTFYHEAENGPWKHASDAEHDAANGWAIELAAEYARLTEDRP